MKAFLIGLTLFTVAVIIAFFAFLLVGDKAEAPCVEEVGHQCDTVAIPTTPIRPTTTGLRSSTTAPRPSTVYVTPATTAQPTQATNTTRPSTTVTTAAPATTTKPQLTAESRPAAVTIAPQSDSIVRTPTASVPVYLDGGNPNQGYGNVHLVIHDGKSRLMFDTLPTEDFDTIIIQTTEFQPYTGYHVAFPSKWVGINPGQSLDFDIEVPGEIVAVSFYQQ